MQNPISTPRILIMGGGVAGLSFIQHAKHANPDCDITLLDQQTAFIERTALHTALLHHPRHLRIDYNDLAKQLGFAFKQTTLSLTDTQLAAWSEPGGLAIDNQVYDFLVVATGRPASQSSFSGAQTVADLASGKAREAFHHWLGSTPQQTRCVAVLGAGATGVQLACELRAACETLQQSARIVLVNNQTHALPHTTQAMQAYAVQSLKRQNIELITETQAQSFNGNVLTTSNQTIDCQLLFDCTGNADARLSCNAFGQLQLNHDVLKHLFACGDNAHFAGAGANDPTAQLAKAKAQTVAHNLHALTCGEPMQPYAANPNAYVVSLGPNDAVGWVQAPHRLIKGKLASQLKHRFEQAWRLQLQGVLPSVSFNRLAESCLSI